MRCHPCRPRRRACDGRPYGPLERAALRGACEGISAGGDKVGQDAYADYQVLLNLPGSWTGSYSRNLNHLWVLGAVVALWDAPPTYVEWYSPALAPGRTHVAVNQSSLAREVARARRDGGHRTALLAGARAVHDAHLTPRALARAYRRAWAALRGHFNFASALDDDAVRAALFAGAACKGVSLVEVTLDGRLPDDALAKLAAPALRDYQEAARGAKLSAVGRGPAACRELLRAARASSPAANASRWHPRRTPRKKHSSY